MAAVRREQRPGRAELRRLVSASEYNRVVVFLSELCVPSGRSRFDSDPFQKSKTGSDTEKVRRSDTEKSAIFDADSWRPKIT